jgi:hypothetical protein
MSNSTRVIVALLLAGAAGTAATACAPLRHRSAQPPAIIFVNESLDQADVYAVSSAAGQVRIGTVPPGRTDTLTVPGTTVGRTIDVVARVLSKSIAPRSGPIMLDAGNRVRVTLPVDEHLLSVLPAAEP